MKNRLKVLLPVLLVFCNAVSGQDMTRIIPGAENISEFIDLIKGRNVSIVANQTSLVGNKHLVDTLLALGIKVRQIFSPEHGFRHLADAGEPLTDGKDPETGIQIISLYGKQYKPTPENLN